MQLRIRAPHLDVPPATRAAVERRVRLALSRHAPSIVMARVTLLPSDRGESWGRCRIRVRLREGESLAAQDQAEHLHEAASGAARRLEQRLERRRVLPSATRRGLRFDQTRGTTHPCRSTSTHDSAAFRPASGARRNGA